MLNLYKKIHGAIGFLLQVRIWDLLPPASHKVYINKLFKMEICMLMLLDTDDFSY